MTCHPYLSRVAEEWCPRGGLALGHGPALRSHKSSPNLGLQKHLSQMYVIPGFRDEDLTVLPAACSKV